MERKVLETHISVRVKKKSLKGRSEGMLNYLENFPSVVCKADKIYTSGLICLAGQKTKRNNLAFSSG